MKKVLNILVQIGFGVIFLLVLAALSLQIFAPQVFDDWNRRINSLFEREEVMKEDKQRNDITLVYPHEMPKDFEVTAFNPQWRAVLLNMYDPIVQVDRNLQIKPGLAVSWGRLDEVVWEFRIRPGVKFHDGRALTVEDVVTSIKRAQNFSGSELRTMLANVRTVKKQDASRFRVFTHEPDPLLLNKLATVLVFPETFNRLADSAMGTGPYELASVSDGDGILLVRNGNYWGEAGFFDKGEILFMPNHEQRIDALRRKVVDLVVNVPPGAIEILKSEGFKVIDRPNLQVNFLLFNFENEFFAKRIIRHALRQIFDKQQFVQLTEGYAKPVDQFVSNGIFGFSPQINPAPFDIEAAKEIVLKESGFEKPRVTFHMIDGLQKFGEYIVTQLELAGVGVDIEYLSQEEISKSLQQGGADLYFLGWRSELGDAGDFLRSIAHSRNDDRSYGFYNGINYFNEELDKLIELSEVNLSVQESKQQLQKAMEVVVDDDIMGIPLYESEIIYGFLPDIDFTPRVDSYVLVQELGLIKTEEK